MALPAQPSLSAGRAYRTQDLARWSANPTRLARRLVREGKLREAAHGIYYAPVPSKFGPAPASDEALLRGFFGKDPFLVTGPPRWNALGLGATAMFATTLVYNTRRSGEHTLDGRRFLMRRVYFPRRPSPEWFVVDLLRHHDMAGVPLRELAANLVVALREGRFDAEELRRMTEKYAEKATLAVVEACIAQARAA